MGAPRLAPKSTPLCMRAKRRIGWTRRPKPEVMRAATGQIMVFAARTWSAGAAASIQAILPPTFQATADGQVTRAGWAGGYGRQVRIAHGGGLATSYSHMSRMVVEPGAFVRQGQLIGYVGSSGLSTGPHLHYEVLQGGTAVNPMSVRFAAEPAVDPAMTEAVKARLKVLLGAGLRS